MIRSKVLSEERSDESKDNKNRFFVYVLRTSSDTLYIGQTNNLNQRIKEHQNKNTKSAKYIKYFDSFKLVYSEEYPTRIEAMRREFQLKKWTRAKKEALIARNIRLLKKTLIAFSLFYKQSQHLTHS